MNHCVPEFEMDDDYSIPTSSSAHNRPRKSPVVPEDDIMELLWQDGQVVMQSQNQRSTKKLPPSRYDAVGQPDQSAPREIRASTHELQQQNQHLFMQEDEMASWLHYPLQDTAFDHDFCADLLYPSPSVSAAVTPPVRPPDTTSFAAAPSRPPIPPPRRPDAVQNFAYFSRHKARAEPPGPSSSKSAAAREATVVDSCETLAARVESRVSEAAKCPEGASGVNIGGGRTVNPAASTAGGGGGKEVAAYDLTSSPGCSSASADPAQKPPADDRKRKGREGGDDAEYHSEDVEFESADAKKQGRGSTSTKRSRAAEVHNLSERRRRDRINEKMKALQELIPRCNKSDKASMLDEAIEYLKSLQLQVQMMSMGCSMVPMMFPGVQQYMPPMGIGMGMGMGMGMEMGMNRPMMHFPNVLAGSALPTTAASGHLGPRFPLPSFPMPPVTAPDPSRIQGSNQSDTMLNPLGMQNPNQPRVPNFPDPYQQYLGFHQMQLPPPQNQATTQPSTSKPSTSRGAENHEHDQ